MKHYYILSCCSLVLAVGCFRHEVTERQLSDSCYLSFPKLESAIQVQLEGDAPRSFSVKPDGSTKYEIPSGTWRMKVSRDGKLLMDRTVFVSAGQTREFDLR